MRRVDIIWGAIFATFFLFYGTCALFGYYPGARIGVTMFAQLSERYGAVETGLGAILIGLLLAIWVLSSRLGAPWNVASNASMGARSTTDNGSVRFVGSAKASGKRALRFPALPNPISVVSLLWAVGIFSGALYVGITVMTGPVPGLNSGVSWIEAPARFLVETSAKIGQTLTGVGVIAGGTLLALACLYSNSTSEWE